jgi:murein DD-endopeptidase MepM/ murein hydrolase activator NlpD
MGSFLLGAVSAAAITSLLFLASLRPPAPEAVYADSLAVELPAPVNAGASPDPAEAVVPPPAPIDAAVPLPAPGATLIIPVQGVRPGELEDTYTDARGEGRSHDAIDIIAPRGTPVLSVAPSTVLKRFQSVRGGITLYTLSADGRMIFYYAHLDRYADGIVEGQPLQAGDVIAYVGDTGNAGEANYHLHFSVSLTDDPTKFWAGKPVNPYPLLVGEGGGQGR